LKNKDFSPKSPKIGLKKLIFGEFLGLNISMSKYTLSHLNQPENQWVIGPIQDDEALFLYSVIRVKRIKTVFEIGGLNGYSAKNFLAAVGSDGFVFTVDINFVQPQSPNHICITKDARDITAEDLHNQKIEMVFFDCHAYDVQMEVYNKLLNQELIDDNTVIALHDTNIHYPNVRGQYCTGPANEPIPYFEDDVIVGYVHQPVERDMVNAFVEMGYHAFCLHTAGAHKHDESFPNRHGVTILSKFKKL
jgi:O-methyltransferase